MLIYADFNGIEKCKADPDSVLLNLTGYGTLASLSLHKIKLYEGGTIDLCDPEGLMATGILLFDKTKVSNNSSGWFAQFKRNEISEGEPIDHDYSNHICFNCRENIKKHLDKVGRQFNEVCPYCGTPVMCPLSAPDH
jgi:hypothetical protein